MSGADRRLLPLVGVSNSDIKIHEIYESIQGESTYAGLPCTFIRTTACHLRCRYCDTAHAFFEGETKSVQAVLEEVAQKTPRLIEVTGGEPLLQPGVFKLLEALCDADLKVLLETSGAVDVSKVDERVVKIVDIKTPGSGEVDANVWENLPLLLPHDEVKFVLCDREDYLWAKDIIRTKDISVTTLMGPVFGQLDPKDLAEWIVEDGLNVRMQIQQHKFIWEPRARGV